MRELTYHSSPNWQYKLGMTIGRTRSEIYRDDDLKVQKEVHGNNISYFIDGDKNEYYSEEHLIEELVNRQNKIS